MSLIAHDEIHLKYNWRRAKAMLIRMIIWSDLCSFIKCQKETHTLDKDVTQVRYGAMNIFFSTVICIVLWLSASKFTTCGQDKRFSAWLSGCLSVWHQSPNKYASAALANHLQPCINVFLLNFSFIKLEDICKTCSTFLRI